MGQVLLVYIVRVFFPRTHLLRHAGTVFCNVQSYVSQWCLCSQLNPPCFRTKNHVRDRDRIRIRIH
jgi:hypothetical protein